MEAIWKQMPTDMFLENVLCFLDIDTRRAFNVNPRKLALPQLNIYPPRRVGILNLVELPNGAEIIYDNDTYIFTPNRNLMNFQRQRYET